MLIGSRCCWHTIDWELPNNIGSIWGISTAFYLLLQDLRGIYLLMLSCLLTNGVAARCSSLLVFMERTPKSRTPAIWRSVLCSRSEESELSCKRAYCWVCRSTQYVLILQAKLFETTPTQNCMLHPCPSIFTVQCFCAYFLGRPQCTPKKCFQRTG